MAEEKRTRPSRSLENYTTEELNALIRADIDGTQPLEEDFLNAILSELVARNPISEEQKIAAWERFQQNRERIEQEKRVKKILEWVSKEDEPRNLWKAGFARIGVWVVTISLVILLVSVPVRGSESLFQVFVRWTEDLFSAGVVEPELSTLAPSSPEEDGLSQIQAELDRYGVTEKLVPSWLPEGYSLDNMSSYKLDNGIYVSAVFVSGDDSILLTFRSRGAGSDLFGEKMDLNVKPYTVMGVTYYIMSNTEDALCIWTNGKIQGEISGDLLYSDMEAIINSIR